MISALLSRIVILFFGTLYPAYASYKIVKSKDVRSYVKWMMYWIVFAIFTSAETFTDIFLCWFPFYYELKILTVFWLLSPATNGSSFLYRKFVHPLLTHHEEEIDEYLSKIKEHGYNTVLSLGSRGLNYAASTIMQTAVKSLPQLAIDNNIINNQGTSSTDHVSETDSLLTITSSERNINADEVIKTDSDNDSDDEFLSEKVKKAKKQKTRSQPQRRSKRKGLST